MTDLILYHYDLSPFSEKIRLMLGYTGLPWQSVKVMEMPPRPVIDTLVDGYRKIPVAQIGADVYCDTKTITTEIARLSGKPELALENCSTAIQAFVQKADSEVFMALVLSSAGPGALISMIKETSLLRTLRFLKDRIGIARQAKMKTISRKQGKQIIHDHFSEMEDLLKQSFLFAEEPCIADFSAYHSINITLDMKGPKLFDGYPNVADWFNRMQAFGHGSFVEITDEQALNTALNAEPVDLGSDSVGGSKQVCIAPDDYARDASTGLLVGESNLAWILQREHPRIGTVHMHFPKAGFSLEDA